MNVGIRTFTPYVMLLDMPVLQYMRYERALVRQIQRQEEEKQT